LADYPEIAQRAASLCPDEVALEVAQQNRARLGHQLETVVKHGRDPFPYATEDTRQFWEEQDRSERRRRDYMLAWAGQKAIGLEEENHQLRGEPLRVTAIAVQALKGLDAEGA
jgi:hypothetical protein